MSVSSTSWNRMNNDTFSREKYTRKGKSKKTTYVAVEILEEGSFGRAYSIKPSSSKSKAKVLKLFKRQNKELNENEQNILSYLKDKVPEYQNYLKGAGDGDWIVCRKMTESFESLRERLPFWEFLAKLEELAVQLDTLHQSGVVHHDIGRNNIMYHAKDKKLYFIDFGDASMMNPEGSETDLYGDYGSFLLVLRQTIEFYNSKEQIAFPPESRMKEELRQLYEPEPLVKSPQDSVASSSSDPHEASVKETYMQNLIAKIRNFRAQYEPPKSETASCQIV